MIVLIILCIWVRVVLSSRKKLFWSLLWHVWVVLSSTKSLLLALLWHVLLLNYLICPKKNVCFFLGCPKIKSPCQKWKHQMCEHSQTTLILNSKMQLCLLLKIMSPFQNCKHQIYEHSQNTLILNSKHNYKKKGKLKWHFWFQIPRMLLVFCL